MLQALGADRRPVSPVIDAGLARRLIDSQFPQWSHLPIRTVDPGGWDNRTFRLGAEPGIRLPSGEWYAEQVDIGTRTSRSAGSSFYGWRAEPPKLRSASCFIVFALLPVPPRFRFGLASLWSSRSWWPSG